MFLRGGVCEQFPSGSFDICYIQERKTGAARGCTPTWIGFDEHDEAVLMTMAERWNAAVKQAMAA